MSSSTTTRCAAEHLFCGPCCTCCPPPPKLLSTHQPRKPRLHLLDMLSCLWTLIDGLLGHHCASASLVALSSITLHWEVTMLGSAEALAVAVNLHRRICSRRSHQCRWVSMRSWCTLLVLTQSMHLAVTCTWHHQHHTQPCTSTSLQALQVCFEMLKFASWLAEADTVCRNKDLSSLADRSPVSLPVLDACHAWQLPHATSC